MDCSPPGSSVHGDSPGKNTGVGCHALLKINYTSIKKKKKAETSLVIQKFRLWASNAKGAGLISGQETKSPHAMQYNQKIKKKKKACVHGSKIISA